MNAPHLLIVHPEASVRAMLVSMLQALGHPIDEAASDRAAVRWIEQVTAIAVIVVTDPNDPDAMELLSYIRRKHPKTSVILLLTTPHPERQREAAQWGAASVLRYPLPASHLRAAVAQAIGGCDEPFVPAANGEHLEPDLNHHDSHAKEFEESPPVRSAWGKSIVSMSPAVVASWPLIGQDPKLLRTLELAASIAATPAPVLIVGERGTGKSLLGRSLHYRGSQRSAPLVVVDCSALPEAQLEAELFGSQTIGGFRPGRLAPGHQGTVVLDEIDAMPLSLQSRLAHLLQDGEFGHDGSPRSTPTNIRFVFTTRADLPDLVTCSRFRPDLYYRMSIVTLPLPSLRYRGDDITRLAEHFRARFSKAIGKDTTGFTTEALALLFHHGWPGNVLELENVVERAVVVCRGPQVDISHLEISHRDPQPAPRFDRSIPRRREATPPIQPLKEALEEPERQFILQALEALNWNRQETARVLDINRTTLYKKMKKYGLLFDEPAWAN